MPVLSRVTDAVGAALAAAIAPWGPIRDAKPLHPDGVLYDAQLTVTDPAPALGVPALVERGELDCLVRVSRAVGLPRRLPDVTGLALRLRPAAAEGAHEDLLFASTGSGRLGRWLLVLRRRPGTLTTLLPVESPAGPAVFALEPHGVASYILAWAHPTGPWRPIGRLTLLGRAADVPDPTLRFDPVENQVAGLAQYDWVTRLREPAYRWARRLWPAGH